MNRPNPEFRFCYSTSLYVETVSFYKNILQLEEFNSWDRGERDRGTIFKSPNGMGFIEIEDGTAIPIVGAELYIEVEDVDAWYELLADRKVNIIHSISDKSYGHRNFKFTDPNNIVIGFFKYCHL